MNSDEWYDAHHPQYPPLDREFLDGEEIHDPELGFIGTIKANADGTWQIDSCRSWGNLTNPNQPSREQAIKELAEHARYRNRIDALHAEKVTG